MPRTITRTAAAPTRGRRVQADDDADRYAPEPDDQDGYEAERPARSRRRTEEAVPAGRPTRGRRAEPEEDTRPARGRRAARDDDDAPRGPRRDTGDKAERQGWGRYSERRAAKSNFPGEVKLGKERILIKFLEDGPFDTWEEHFSQVENRGYTCPRSLPGGAKAECPLCDELDLYAGLRTAFNVVVADENEPEVKMLRLSANASDTIRELSEGKRTSPLNRVDLYFEVWKTGEKKKTQVHIEYVRADELPNTYGIEPFTEEELAALDEHLQEAFIRAPQLSDLEAAADKLLDASN